MLPNTMALAGQDCWQAVCNSPSAIFRSSLFRLDAMLIDALHAVRALFHHAAAAHGDIRIAHHLELRRVPILEQKEVEAPHFVGTVVGAIPRAHAAVVNHVVQAFGAVRGRAHRANYSQGAFSHCMHGTGWK